MKNPTTKLGLGIGWRPELALLIDRRTDLGFVEITAEHFRSTRDIPSAIELLVERGVSVIPHGIGLSLGGAERPDPARLKHLAALAKYCGSPMVSEHVAFVRAGDLEAGHLLPVPRTRETLDILVENVRIATDALPVPLALENISTLFGWPDDEIEEGEFLAELLDRTGAGLLLDVANVYANAVNQRRDPLDVLNTLPLDRLAYVHMGGGVERGGVYHDTHAHAVPPGAIRLLRELANRSTIPGVMLERDDDFPPDDVILQELDAIASAMRPNAEVTDVR